MIVSKIGAFLAVPAAIAAIVGGVLAFNGSYVSKDSFESKVQNVEYQLAGVLKDFRDDFQQERQLRREDTFQLKVDHLQSRIEFYEDKLRQLEQTPKKDDYEQRYYERQLDRLRQQHEKLQDALIEIQKAK
jgi:predicted aminopeptidase